MASGFVFNSFTEALPENVHGNLGTATIKLMLSNTAPAATNTVKTDITEISAGNGYTAGGATLGSVTSGQASGTYTLDAATVTWTAAGGNIGPFRYAVLYNDSASGDELIGCWDLGGEQTITAGNSADFEIPSGILKLIKAA